MDPAAYRSWTAAFKDHIPTPAPIPGGPIHHASDEPVQDSDKSMPPDTSKLSKPWMASGDPWAGPPAWDAPKENETTPRPANHAAELYPHPHLYLPHPSLNLEFRMSVTLNPRISLGPTPFGHRNWVSFTGGKWSGSWGFGKVLPGGQDSQIIIPDGSAHLETNYLLETYDKPPAHIAIKTHGWRTGPPEVLAQLSDPELADKVDPDSYKFRLFIEMETGDERYRDKVNCGMWVGSGMRKGAEVIYE
ncbi:UPF0311 protein [Lachnellula subtilissima]|uniref:UPF0311 protein n=1 Tax=Lachnellula subtilissima TaxID=602034 RepID=A0A8H8RU34_9HELO|nr:UPF0311 protein [Lachnellula subtilissima]